MSEKVKVGESPTTTCTVCFTQQFERAHYFQYGKSMSYSCYVEGNGYQPIYFSQV